MRLEQIDLKNFGSYRDATIDLRPVTSAVVLGPNGAGKSTAFIDAVLWALYGQARSATDHMIRTGETDMMAAVTFTLNGQRYRAIRRRSVKTKAGKSDLELQVEGEPGEWTPISGGRLNETQDKIVQLLNCDQSLLTATAFFLQGQADRFSRATPGERKAILAGILRLDRYAALKQAASQEAARLEGRRAAMVDQLNDLDAAKIRLSQLHEQHETASLTESLERTSLSQYEAKRTEHLQTKAALQVQLDAMGGLGAKLDQDRQRLTTLRDREQALTTKHDRWQKILQNRDTIQQKVEEHQATTSAIVSLDAAMTGWGGALAIFDRELEESQRNVTALQQLEHQAARVRLEIEQAVRDYRRQTTEMAAALDRDRTQTTLLGQVPCDSGLQARCQFTLKAVEAQHRIPSQTAALEARPIEEGQIVPLVASRQAQELLDLDGRIRAGRQQDWGQRAEASRHNKQNVQAQQQEGRQELDRLKRTLKDLERFTMLVPELELAGRELAGITTDLASAIQERSAVEQAIKAQELELLGTDTIKADLADTTARLRNLESLITQCHQTIQGTTRTIGGIVSQIEQARQTIEAGRALEAELGRIDRDLRQYRALRDAYGIIPTLVMENALPILEQETNTLLDKISRTGMRVRFDTQKALKSRDGLAETLDITVRDQVGERPLENYSGGERFRLDLAQRIGLSKLLARRAGAKIETLAIDEGLGSLDEDGLNQLRECLGALGDDFKLVLVITHVDAMKATFPSQIMVTKDQQGSQVEVLA